MRRKRFKPTQQYIDKAKEAYYKRGGTVTKLPYVEKSAETIVEESLTPIGQFCARIDDTEIRQAWKRKLYKKRKKF